MSQGPRLRPWGCSATFSVALLCVAQDKCGERTGGRAVEIIPGQLPVFLLLIPHRADFDHIATYCRRCLYSAQFLIQWKEGRLSWGNNSSLTQPYLDLVICDLSFGNWK